MLKRDKTRKIQLRITFLIMHIHDNFFNFFLCFVACCIHLLYIYPYINSKMTAKKLDSNI